jgi:tetratricopeptide (TPR) repeat protein
MAFEIEPGSGNRLLEGARCRRLSPSGSGRPMSRQELADEANAWLAVHFPGEAPFDRNYVGKLERGKHRWPSEGKRAALRYVLQAGSDRELGFFINRRSRTAERPNQPLGSSPDQPAPADVEVQPQHGLVSSITAIAAGLGLFELTPAQARRRVAVSDVTRIEAVTVLYRSVDYEHGGGALCDDVGRFAEAASALLTHATADLTRGTLAAAVASARQLAGWTAFDGGRHHDASRHWLAAERGAQAAADPRLTARIRYCQARQFQHQQHNQDALETLRLARAELAGRATPALLAMLLGAEAASLAALGDYEVAIRTLAAASARFERIKPEREPDWMAFYDRGELLAQHGRVYRDLARADHGNAGAAIEWTQAAIDVFGPQNVRSTVLNQVGLCSALALAGDEDKALAVGTAVAERGRDLGSQRVHDRIHNLARDIPADTHHSGLADFRRMIRQPRKAAA